MTPKLDTILIGIDLTPPSIDCAAWTAQTFAPDSGLILAHVLETQRILSFFSPSQAKRKTEQIRAEVGERLAKLRSDFGADRVEVRFADGSTGVELVKLAEELGADAISIGADREGIAGGLMGSTVSSVIGRATVPVLIAHDVPDHPPRRILVAVDETEGARRVLAWAGALAERFDANGTVVTAIEPPGIPVNQTLFSSEEEYREARNDVVDRARERVRATMEEASVDPARFTAEARYGRPEQEIISVARDLGADLIVLGTRGFTHGQALMVGSVSRRVIEASECPVFVVPSVPRS
ncbi:MAG: universal stress protein [Gemmatimonadota bacterium]